MTCKLSIDWNNAETLFRRQAELRGRLKKVYRHVQSGLYQGEDPTSFAAFVSHVRGLLSLSPRTVLRKALNEAFQKIRKGKHLEISHLLETLNLDDTQDMNSISDALKRLSPGQRFLDHEKLQKKLLKSQSLDPDETRRRIVNGFRRQKKECTPEVMEAAISRALEKENNCIKQWQKRLADLEQELKTDKDFRRYTKAQQTFQNTGLHALYKNYQAIDLAVCQKRGRRGTALEEHGCQSAFAMIVLDLQQRYPNLNLSDFTYQRNVFWWSGGKQVGEIDICVFWRKTVIAICELKSSCFEITIAVRQHEAKLDELRCGSLSIGETPYQRCSTVQDCGGALDMENLQVRFYLATLLPTEGQDMVGVEPEISNAICAGIRDQDLNIANSLTAVQSQQLIPYLLQSDLIVSKVLSCLRSTSIRPSSDLNQSVHDDIDFTKLRAYVEERISRDILQESPQACLKRYFDQTFVLSPNDVRLRNNLDPASTLPNSRVSEFPSSRSLDQ